ncbi:MULTISPECIES: class I mannose-6-phosphate isomerase [unclassified Novosphingobium]|uniref:class I mannose-6-phosphate isomerase n=1 Tax=unclassified Novosphingobium TaxID=2644732 RepID=UPI001493EF7A|nr:MULTISPECIES: class I mannose-6-phosphate isomerase [unclassified Novosphingobium]MBB3360143.1 mannose-6-phosphate isomerase [Novosphingobium sp. BK256]MBB3376678.1 mannose-6-phosphate isomerase [Novosphingobium sp. BK280]MBB3381091.1 mannose-6-phosphate isomerase [Novosphingobium sp. BK258]MBB3422742.1 mannose-6-phosphate isomerase [Novosphingobium sp. BK267]MBB3451442.1 mannose-6-phosphate isomerase [Novosphingobium sp. BK352]
MSKLPIREVEKPWGKDVLPAPFSAPEGKRIGEIWFEPPADAPNLLVKYIFTSEKLSVQVHPSDAQAAAAGEKDRGKEECWLVIAAEPGATLGVGFKGHVDHDTMRAAALDGSIEDMLVWHPVKPGDFFYIPANTVHAIGAGVSVIEIQQNSDITYRLYDYGRPRELHLDAGIAVSRGEPLDPALHRHIPDTGTVELARGAYFTAHRLQGVPDAALRAEYAGPLLVIPRSGSVTLGDDVLNPGDCASAASIDALTFDPQGQAIIVRPAT